MDWLSQLFHFRNSNHETYFYITASCILLMLLLAYLDDCNSIVGSILVINGFGYLGIAVMAFKIVILDKKESPSFSVDCIWYNSLLVIICAIMRMHVRRRARRI